MKVFIYNILLFTCILNCNLASGQIIVDENAQDDDDTTATTVGVTLYADPRLDVLLKKYRNVQLGVIRSGQGFRVQIYNGNDRVKANQVRVDFIRRFPGIRTYLTYVQPQFRVKVGDFRTRAEAQKMYDETSAVYTPCMIVPDIVVINTMNDD
ncbi:MAG: SPOR domain-containing protein [Flavipsychrobacter sp.]|nr:SPOR domain-containing protein [Flavipsychrobacter sp.]